MTIWQPNEIEVLKPQLRHILWIGGSTDAGKTTTANLLSERLNLPVYHGDHDGKHHWDNPSPTDHSALHTFKHMTMNERWVDTTVDALTTLTLGIATERIKLMIQDWLTQSNQDMMIVEWFGFMPDYVAPLLSSPHQAIWLCPTNAFKQQSITKRDKPNFHRDTSDPQRAWEIHLARDLKLSDIAQSQAQQHGFKTIINDGQQSPKAIAEQAEAHFAPLLNT